MDARIPTMTQTDPPPRTASAKSRVFPTLLLGAASLLVAACASTRIPSTTLTGSDPDAMSILTASQRAHGSEAFATIRDLNIRYASRWSTLGSRGHSVLWDQRYRRESEEALELGSGTIVQLHKGPGGRKFVLRAPGRVTVWYNGQPDSREDVLRAAALVADIEKMELLGPLYFQRPGVILEKIGSAKVDRAECDQVLAVLRPGFGYAEEDRAVLSIDRETQRLRRVATTLDGLKPGGSATMAVTFRTWAQRSGVWWAADFDESIPGLTNLSARHGSLVELKANHGFAPRHPEMLGEALGEAAAQSR